MNQELQTIMVSPDHSVRGSAVFLSSEMLGSLKGQVLLTEIGCSVRCFLLSNYFK